MGVVKGLAAIKGHQMGGGTPFLKLQAGESVRVRFLQELDEASPHFNEEAGLAFLAVEYRSPDDFKKRAVSTLETEGRCWMAEQGWKPRRSLYIAALVTDNNGESRVKIVNQGIGPKSIVPALLEAAEEYGAVTNREFKIKRTGSGMNDTQYTLTPLDPDTAQYDVTQHEIPDLEDVLNNIPYEEQEAFFTSGATDSTPKSGAGVGTEW